MWPWGHAAVAYLLFAGYSRLRGTEPPGDIAVAVLLFGSIFPDLVDKPLAWYLGVLPTGRSLAHSVLFILPVCAAIYVIARRRNRAEWGAAFAFGAISHVVVDALPVLWRDDVSVGFLFYPLTTVETYEHGPPTVLGLLRSSLADPYFHLECVLFAGAIVVWHMHGYPCIPVGEPRE